MIEASIVIPTFRRPELLRRAVASCLAQQGVAAPFEVIVVDNDPGGSARATVDSMTRNGAATIRYVGEPRRGISHARNTGVAQVAGRYVAFLDDDEAAEPDWLAALLATIRRFQADAAVGPIYPHLPAGARDAVGFGRGVYTRDAGVATGTRLLRWSICNGLYDRARCFDAARPPFDPRLGLSGGEDTLFMRQLMRSGRDVVWCAEAIIWETIPAEKLAPRYLLRRTFRGAQATTFVCTAVRPPELARAAFWMAVGCAQVVLYTPVALLLRAINHDRWLPVAAKAVGGLGKVLWYHKLHLQLYR